MLARRHDRTTRRIRDTPWINALLGVWLFMSAFLWPHSAAERADTWIVGVLCVAFSLAATRLPAARWLNALLSVWLFVSAWALPHHNEATVWNNAFVAICVFLLALEPGVPADEGLVARRAEA